MLVFEEPGRDGMEKLPPRPGIKPKELITKVEQIADYLLGPVGRGKGLVHDSDKIITVNLVYIE